VPPYLKTLLKGRPVEDARRTGSWWSREFSVGVTIEKKGLNPGGSVLQMPSLRGKDLLRREGLAEEGGS